MKLTIKEGMAQRQSRTIASPDAREKALRQFRSASPGWTAERIARLSRRELVQLSSNALERAAHEVVELCDAALARAGIVR